MLLPKRLRQRETHAWGAQEFHELELEPEVKKAMYDLDKAASGMLDKALALARQVTIVTNAEQNWVEMFALCAHTKRGGQD